MNPGEYSSGKHHSEHTRKYALFYLYILFSFTSTKAVVPPVSASWSWFSGSTWVKKVHASFFCHKSEYISPATLFPPGYPINQRLPGGFDQWFGFLRIPRSLPFYIQQGNLGIPSHQLTLTRRFSYQQSWCLTGTAQTRASVYFGGPASATVSVAYRVGQCPFQT